MIGSPYSVFSTVSDASTNTSVASNDLWEKTEITACDEPLTEVKPEHLVSPADETNCGPTDSAHLIAHPWAPEYTADKDKGKTIYTALYTQVSYHDLAAELEAWDDGLFVEAEDELPDWRASCASLPFTAPVPSVARTAAHYGPIDKVLLVAYPSEQDSVNADCNMVELPLFAQVNYFGNDAEMDAWDDGLFVDSGDKLPDWRVAHAPISSAPVIRFGSIGDLLDIQPAQEEAEQAHHKPTVPSKFLQTLDQDINANRAMIATHQPAKGKAFSKILRRLGKQKTSLTSDVAAPIKKSAFKKFGRFFTGRRELKEATILSETFLVSRFA